MTPSFKTILLAALFSILAGCSASTTNRDGLPPLQVVAAVDVARYMGTWYEIASFPQSFQEGCTGTTAIYTLRNDGEVDVVNRCLLDDLRGEESVAEGRARVVDTSTNAKLEVSFFRPFWGDYWIIELGDQYDYAVVGHPGRDYLWILSRTPRMTEELYNKLVTRLRDHHRYDINRIKRTVQGAE